jgi:hypothetical protein
MIFMGVRQFAFAGVSSIKNAEKCVLELLCCEDEYNPGYSH